MSKCLVTGGAGFIGSHLVDELVEKGEEVIVIDNLSTGKKENINPRSKFFQLDLRDFKTILPLFEGVDFVFHLAALPRIPLSIERPLESHENNLTATLNVLLASKEKKVKRVIYASSSSVYGQQKELPLREDMIPNPLNPYGFQKYGGEWYCKIFSHLFNLPTVCLRYFNVFGPRASEEGAYATVVGIFLRQKRNGEKLTIYGDGNQTRDFTFVKDVVKGTILASLSDKVGKGEVINIGAGKNYSINQLAEMIGGERVYLPPRKWEVRDTLADISLAKKLLNWEPQYDLESGLKEMMKFYEKEKN